MGSIFLSRMMFRGSLWTGLLPVRRPSSLNSVSMFDVNLTSGDNHKGEALAGKSLASPSESALLLKAAKGGFLGFFGTVVGKSLTLLLQVLVSRLYGPQYYGIFVTGLLVCQITQIISGLGLQKGGMRFLAIAHDQQDYKMMQDVIKTAVFFPLISGICIGAILYGLAPFLAFTVLKKAEMMGVLRQFSFAVPFFTILTISADLSRAFKTTQYAVMIQDLLFSMLQIVFFLTFHALGYGFSSVVYSFVLATIVCSFWILFLVKQQLQRFMSHLPTKHISAKKSILPKNWRPVLAFSLPLTLFGLLLIGSNFMDIILLNILADSSAVGEYAAAARWVMFFGMIAVSLELIFGPLMAGQLGLNRYDQVKVLYRASTRWGFFLTLPVSVFQLLSREPLMLVFGEEFLVHSHDILGILVVGSIFAALSGSAGMLLTISRHQYIELACLTGGLLVNLIMNLLWIPRYGLYGAALAAITTVLLTASARIVLINRVLKMHPFNIHLVAPTVVAFFLIIGGLIVESILNLSIASKVILGAGSGCLTLLSIIATGLDANDRELVKTIMERFKKNSNGLRSVAG